VCRKHHFVHAHGERRGGRTGRDTLTADIGRLPLRGIKFAAGRGEPEWLLVGDEWISCPLCSKRDSPSSVATAPEPPYVGCTGGPMFSRARSPSPFHHAMTALLPSGSAPRVMVTSCQRLIALNQVRCRIRILVLSRHDLLVRLGPSPSRPLPLPHESSVAAERSSRLRPLERFRISRVDLFGHPPADHLSRAISMSIPRQTTSLSTQISPRRRWLPSRFSVAIAYTRRPGFQHATSTGVAASVCRLDAHFPDQSVTHPPRTAASFGEYRAATPESPAASSSQPLRSPTNKSPKERAPNRVPFPPTTIAFSARQRFRHLTC